jgi:ATP-dependent Clp protease ATP-binding subunit ClpA
MFERFTDRARRVVVLAQEEARMLNHNYIGTEHILLGLIHEGEGVAAKSLESLGISLEGVRSQVEEIIGQGQQAPSGHIPFTPRAKKVLELSLREALQLGHNYIGTEHILLGLIREGEGVAAQVLVKLGAKLTRVRQQVIQLLQGYQGAPDQSRMRTEILDRMAKEVTEAIAKDVETIRGLSENIGKWGAQIDNLKALVMTSDSVVNGLAIRSITVLDEANPPVAMVEFSDGSQAVLREDHLRVIGYEAIQGKS